MWLRAERQTEGRGRSGRVWVSPVGNLHASTLVRLRPGDPPPATLALVAGIALHRVLAAFFAGGTRLTLKWPNDVLAGDRKLAGVLLERTGEAVVVGTGVNLAHHPRDMDRPVTSVAAECGVAPPADAFLADLAKDFAAALSTWREAGFEAIRALWLDAAHPPGTPLATHAADGERLTGTFEGLDAGGALRLRLADGAVRLIHAGDVFLGAN